MGKIVSSFFMALDGVVERPDQWHFPYFNDEMGAAVGAGMETAEAFLLGRKMYDEWAAYWPTSDDEQFKPFITNIKKYVVSSTLTEATWNNTTLVTGEDIAGQIQKIKDETAGDIGMSGSATTVRWLMANDLLDELNLLVHPIAVGHGQRLFEDVETTRLELKSSKTFSTGVLHLIYGKA